MVTIKNLRKEQPTEPYQVKVDRSSVLGNPFHMQTEYDRNNVCNEYTKYFNNQLTAQTSDAHLFRMGLSNLIIYYKQYGKLELFCWCAPKRCHAETIKKYIETGEYFYEN